MFQLEAYIAVHRRYSMMKEKKSIVIKYSETKTQKFTSTYAEKVPAEVIITKLSKMAPGLPNKMQ